MTATAAYTAASAAVGRGLSSSPACHSGVGTTPGGSRLIPLEEALDLDPAAQSAGYTAARAGLVHRRGRFGGHEIGGGVADDQAAPRGKIGHEILDHAIRVIGVAEEVQHGQQHHTDRAACRIPSSRVT
jgi:hypothetical protein